MWLRGCQSKRTAPSPRPPGGWRMGSRFPRFPVSARGRPASASSLPLQSRADVASFQSCAFSCEHQEARKHPSGPEDADAASVLALSLGKVPF